MILRGTSSWCSGVWPAQICHRYAESASHNANAVNPFDMLLPAPGCNCQCIVIPIASMWRCGNTLLAAWQLSCCIYCSVENAEPEDVRTRQGDATCCGTDHWRSWRCGCRWLCHGFTHLRLDRCSRPLSPITLLVYTHSSFIGTRQASCSGHAMPRP